MRLWPFIKTAPPASPYDYGPPAYVNPGVGTGDRGFSTGQFNIPYGPYDRRHIVQRDLAPLKGPGLLAFQNVRPVDLMGFGTYIAGTARVTGLGDMENGAEPARGVLG